jgi:hypothetical protein
VALQVQTEFALKEDGQEASPQPEDEDQRLTFAMEYRDWGGGAMEQRDVLR